MRGLTNSQINQIHQKMIFRLIWENGPISRSQIQKVLGLSKSTVSVITRELINKNLIQEIGQQDSPLGRKPKNLSINYNYFHLLGIQIKDSGEIEAGLVNFGGKIKKWKKTKIANNSSPQEAVKAVSILINRYLSTPLPLPILGIGIGVPGIVNHQKGIIEYSTHFNWKNFPLKKLIQKEIAPEISLIVDNRTMATTLGEVWFGDSRENKNFICVNYGYAIGAGIVIDGKLYRGSPNGAGEIGQIRIETLNQDLEFTTNVSLESLSSLPTIMESLGETYEGESKAARKLKSNINHPKVQKSLKQAFANLGKVTGILIATLAPESIVFAGALPQVAPYMFREEVQKWVQATTLETMFKKVSLKISSLTETKELLGSASLVLEDFCSLNT